MKFKELAPLFFSSLLFVSCGPGETQTESGKSAKIASDVIERVFYDDDGSECVIYISLDESRLQSNEKDRAVVWDQLNAEDFKVCDGTEPSSLGLVTIRGLDDYGQPDWSKSKEHYFYTISDWPDLITACNSTDKKVCNDNLASVLVLESN